MGALMNPAHLIRLDARLPALIAEVDAAGRAGTSWLATWRSVAPRLLEVTGSSAEHPRLRSREALPKLKEYLTSVWLRGANPGPLPTDSWAEDDAAAQGAAG